MTRERLRVLELPSGSPKIVCLCGSTRFKQEFINAAFRFTMDGWIVLTVGWFSHSYKEVFHPTEEQKQDLDRLHLWKIDVADSVYVVNPGGYIGESTAGEIAYAKNHGKLVEYLEGTA